MVEGSLGIFYSQSGQYPRIWIKMIEKLFRMGYYRGGGSEPRIFFANLFTASATEAAEKQDTTCE